MPDMNDCSTRVSARSSAPRPGTGINRGSQEARFDETVRLSSNPSVQTWSSYAHQGGRPVLICRGLKHIGCTQCRKRSARLAENYTRPRPSRHRGLSPPVVHHRNAHENIAPRASNPRTTDFAFARCEPKDRRYQI